jgi:hypothetical protein
MGPGIEELRWIYSRFDEVGLRGGQDVGVVGPARPPEALAAGFRDDVLTAEPAAPAR